MREKGKIKGEGRARTNRVTQKVGFRGKQRTNGYLENRSKREVKEALEVRFSNLALMCSYESKNENRKREKLTGFRRLKV